ncbi:hypothetical protein [Paenibacillus sp. MBLB4367]|uniref:hypothetical protein n=1 Tax=Paenibacillus sp. MBLB4367 TaxID=3384767 RepID=UPI0039083B05
MHAQPLTAKELEYVADCMSNEDLLIKQCYAASATTLNAATLQFCGQMLQTHTQHYQTLMHLLDQHRQMAPTQPQLQ